MDHIFIVISASDLKSKEANICEIAAVRTDGQIGPVRKNSVLAAFTTLVSKKESDESATIKLALNMLKSSVLDSKFTNRYVVITCVSDIARALLRNECSKLNIDEPFAGRAWIDVAQLAWPLLVNGMIKDRGLESLSKHFNVPFESKDNAADICTSLVSVYGHMMRRYKTALAGEEAIRDVGGETLENIRRMVGF